MSQEGTESEVLARGLAIILSVIGLCASVAFSQMLRFGRRYLLARKQAVVELEEYMAWHGGHRIVARENGWLKSSPTGLIMVLLPFTVALCWLAIMGVLIVG